MPRALHGDDLVIEARPTGLVLADKFRLEAAMPVSGNINRYLAKLAFQCLLAAAIANVAGFVGDSLMAAMAKVILNLCFERSLDQGFGQLLKNPIFPSRSSGFLDSDIIWSMRSLGGFETVILSPLSMTEISVSLAVYTKFRTPSTSDAKRLLNKDVQLLKENPDTEVRMAGYTSARGSEEVKQKLSEKRANVVRNYLLGKGIAPERITTIGYGRTKPALYEVKRGDINTKEAQDNMRVLFEIVVK